MSTTAPKTVKQPEDHKPKADEAVKVRFVLDDGSEVIAEPSRPSSIVRTERFLGRPFRDGMEDVMAMAYVAAGKPGHIEGDDAGFFEWIDRIVTTEQVDGTPTQAPRTS